MKYLKLICIGLAFAALAGCNESTSRIGPRATDKIDAPYQDSGFKGVRKYCFAGVLYYGWLTASNGDWMTPAYDQDSGDIIRCNFQENRTYP